MPGSSTGYDEMQALFLMRLMRLSRLRMQLELAPEGDARRRLVDAAFRSTFHDCESLGVAGEAYALLEAD